MESHGQVRKMNMHQSPNKKKERKKREIIEHKQSPKSLAVLGSIIKGVSAALGQLLSKIGKFINHKTITRMCIYTG